MNNREQSQIFINRELLQIIEEAFIEEVKLLAG